MLDRLECSFTSTSICAFIYINFERSPLTRKDKVYMTSEGFNGIRYSDLMYIAACIITQYILKVVTIICSSYSPWSLLQQDYRLNMSTVE